MTYGYSLHDIRLQPPLQVEEERLARRGGADEAVRVPQRQAEHLPWGGSSVALAGRLAEHLPDD